jgi:hypothetical protein
MSDIRLQNLLHSVKQIHLDHKDGHEVRAAAFDMKAGALPSALADYLANYQSQHAAQAEIIIEAKVVDVIRQEPLRNDASDQNSKSRHQALIKIDGQSFTLPLPATTSSKGQLAAHSPIAAGDVFLIQPSPTKAGHYLVFHLSAAEQEQSAALLRAEAAQGTIFNSNDVAATRKYAERIEQLRHLEVQIDALQKIIPQSNDYKTALLRSFPIDLEGGAANIRLPVISTQLSLAPIMSGATHLPVAPITEDRAASGSIIIRQNQINQPPAPTQTLAHSASQPLILQKGAASDQHEAVQIKFTHSSSEASVLALGASVDTAITQAVLRPPQPSAVIDVELSTAMVGSVTNSTSAVIFDPKLQQSLPATHHDSLLHAIDALVVEKPAIGSSAAYRSDDLFMSRITTIEEAPVNAQLLINTGAGRLSAKIIGETAEGFKVAQPEWAGWPARSALILGQVGAADTDFIRGLSAGDVLNIALPITLNGVVDGEIAALSSSLLSADASQSSSHTSAQMPSQISMPGHLTSFIQSSQAINGFIQALDPLMEALMLPPSQLNLSPMQAVMPNMAKPVQLLPAMLFLMAAFHNGDVGQLVGDKGQEGLSRLGKSGLLNNLLKAAQNGSAVQRSQPEKGSVGSEWRSSLLPMQVEGQTQIIAMHWMDHHGNKNDEEGGEEEKLSRFILDFSLSSMGAAQIDGFYKDKRLDVALRLEALPSEAMRNRVQNFYIAALGQTDLTGDLRFQLITEKVVTFKAVISD